uniref:JmjC domain-containing protein n=1 Tax=Globisporangium ultimum (strain ATCC 200006 / CBS 805.95 / DAOM BR144) TaxID=431595 RepID=K3X8M4_GLOUD
MEVVDAQTLRYDEFCARFLATNTPVKLRNVASKWFQVADAQWRCAHDGSINFDALKVKYGHAQVPVVDGDVVEYGAEARTTMRFDEYLALLQKNDAGKRYLKDWHFVHAFPDQPVYTTPTFFEDDWLNWWWDRQEQSGDDYRFVYIGPAGSWTPMHHDVFRSYSWSVNITGRKEWIFFHPDEEWKLKDRFGRYVIPDVTMEDVDRTQFPHIHEAIPIHVTQETGEAIFVPSGWYHQVKNVEATISINHNWFNGYNLDQLWQFFQREYDAVENELEDLKELGLVGREFKDQCQVVMKANTGINYTEFRAMLYSKAHELLTTRWKQHKVEVSQGTMMFDQDLRAHLSTLSHVLSDLTVYFTDEEAPQHSNEEWIFVDKLLKELCE